MTEKPFFSSLKGRGILRISGRDRKNFLQGLITNDINLLDNQPCLYTCLLTPQGKFLYDFFIYEENQTLVLDCEGGERAQTLAKLFGLYKLRSDITVEVNPDATLYAVFGENTGTPDPRHAQMGNRSFIKPTDNIEEMPFEAWDKHRISLCVPDGSRDLIPQNSALSEGRIDELNGVSYTKGCYMGQELTARMHYRGLAKKHLRTVTPDDIGTNTFPPPQSPITKDERVIGEMRSSCGDIGLALLKD